MRARTPKLSWWQLLNFAYGAGRGDWALEIAAALKITASKIYQVADQTGLRLLPSAKGQTVAMITTRYEQFDAAMRITAA